MAVRILIVEDQMWGAVPIQWWLDQDPGFEMVGIARDKDEAVAKVRTLSPNLVLMDVKLPEGEEGLEATHLIREQYPDTKVLIVTGELKAQWVDEAHAAGAKGYITKDTHPDRLAGLIRAVMRGEEIWPRVIRQFKLTVRQVEVLRLLARGLKNKEIAKKLRITERTVKDHVTRIFSELDVRNRTEAGLLARKERLI